MRLSIRAALGELLIGSTIANIHRRDFAARAMGDGSHGFNIMFDCPINAEDNVHIEIIAFHDGEEQGKTNLRVRNTIV